jgi:hypothetical protein
MARSVQNKITTAGVPLGVHPGLKDATTANRLSQERRLPPERHLSASRLSAMAIGSHTPKEVLNLTSEYVYDSLSG